MDIQNRRGLKEAARVSLANAAYDPRKLVLIHTLASVLFALAVTIPETAILPRSSPPPSPARRERPGFPPISTLREEAWG